MPSTNPYVTPGLNLPAPVPADPPDIPGDIKALADQIDESIQAAIEVVTTDNLDGNNVQQFTVTFPRSFTHPPAVTLTSGRTDFVATLSGTPTATGFVFYVRQFDPIGSKVQTFPVHWIAIGATS